MAQFDVYVHPDARIRERTPYLLDVQNTFLDRIATRVVIPLRSAEFAPLPMRDLNPVCTVEGQAMVLDTAALAAVPLRWLGEPLLNLRADSPQVVNALDILFGGY
ncbi:CcdB family protein [Limnohabitans planktonicus]|uniref:Toxin CcdB n=1 Tax=Limnohabitans planktonicus II-D5 TaxID=1293045 RepID=A0A2T7UCJ3_9BURK|nr:CcdB family protein [Limnohabitans planktonicus]PVE42416.1 plasmid maintenance protein CcdB [Limnohabitans planktonicus II-D5]|eukprot:gene29526-36592_t